MADILLFYFNNENLLKEFENRSIKTKKFSSITISELESLSDEKIIYTAYKKISCTDLNKLINLGNMQIILHKIENHQQLNNSNEPYTFKMIKSSQNIYAQSLYVKDFIINFIVKSSNFKLTGVNKYLFRNRRDLNIDVIMLDLIYLNKKGILTSRLAIFIYKITTFNYMASDREIGQFYASQYGKSKNYTCKQYNIENTKGYAILNTNQQNFFQKIELATKLIRNCGCDIHCLSEAIGLSVDDLRVYCT